MRAQVMGKAALRLSRRFASSITYPAPPPSGCHSGRLMDPAVWPKIAPIWPSSSFFAHDIGSLHEEDDVRAVTVGNARTISATLNTHGFGLLASPCHTDFDDETQLAQYKEATAQLVAEATGAAICVAFNSVRIDTQLDRFGKRGGAVERVHGDYTPASGPNMLAELCQRGVLPPDAEGRRGAILNVWRNTSATPVQSKPLAVCDVRSVAPDTLGTYYLVEGGEAAAPRRMGENLKLHYSPAHAWWYYPSMTRDEALVFWTYDGRVPDMPRFTLHCAFEPEGAPQDAPPRRAIIVRCAAVW